LKILITGAKGFVGSNLVASLENIRDGKDHTHVIKTLYKNYGYGSQTDDFPYNPADLEIVKFDKMSGMDDLENACRDCDFVFHFAGVNRTKDNSEFMKGNFGLLSCLLKMLKKYHNICPVMYSSSVQATLLGRFADSEYGKSKLAGEELLLKYAEETGAKALLYRFPNLFGKWCRPNYNSAVATFCNNIANDLDIQVNDRNTELDLVYIDDLIEEMLRALNGQEHREGHYCYVPVSYHVTLGHIVDQLRLFHDQPATLVIPETADGSFEKKLYSTYLSYLPQNKVAFPLKMNIDNRGSFTELFRTENCGQLSVNISKPGVTKGQHWHHSKWEFFIVVKGHGLIQERRIGTDPVTGDKYPIIEFEVDGDHIQTVHMLPGYTHNIINLSTTEDMVTVMWANEKFDADHPDTYREFV
jgi:UDP-2-acetamido-2,6-beta-L-arabino-hexul-4-ose reductase